MNRALQIALPFDAPAPASVPAPPATATIASTSATIASTSTTIAPLYFIRHRRARRYLLRVEPDGRLRVTIPRGGSKREAQAFAERQVAWIAGQRARLTAPTFSLEERRLLRARAEAELPGRIRDLAAEHEVVGLTRVSIRSQRTRWGSCGRNGHIALNWRLVLMPPEVRDYVLIHELMHLRRMDHSPAFWRHVASACLSFAASRAWLRAHGKTLR